MLNPLLAFGILAHCYFASEYMIKEANYDEQLFNAIQEQIRAGPFNLE